MLRTPACLTDSQPTSAEVRRRAANSSAPAFSTATGNGSDKENWSGKTKSARGSGNSPKARARSCIASRPMRRESAATGKRRTSASVRAPKRASEAAALAGNTPIGKASSCWRSKCLSRHRAAVTHCASQCAPSGVGAAASSTEKPCACTPACAASANFSTPPNRRRQLPISSNRLFGVTLMRGVRQPAQQARACIAAASRDGLRGIKVMAGANMRAAATPTPRSTPACRAPASARRMRPCSIIALGDGKGALASSGNKGRWSASQSGGGGKLCGTIG